MISVRDFYNISYGKTCVINGSSYRAAAYCTIPNRIMFVSDEDDEEKLMINEIRRIYCNSEHVSEFYIVCDDMDKLGNTFELKILVI